MDALCCLCYENLFRFLIIFMRSNLFKILNGKNSLESESKLWKDGMLRVDWMICGSTNWKNWNKDDDGSVLDSATNFPNIFFLMHKWFTTSEVLAHELRKLFEAGKGYGDYVPLLTLSSPPPPPPPTQPQAQPPSASDPLPSAAPSFSRPSSVIMPRKQVHLTCSLIWLSIYSVPQIWSEPFL